MAKILIAGCGDVGTGLATTLAGQGHTVFGLRRHPPDSETPFVYVKADLANAGDLRALDPDFDEIFFTAAPDSRTEDAYRAVFEVGLKNLVTSAPLRNSDAHLFFVSSSSVYGQTSGEWVDEESPTHPAGSRGQILLEAEQLVLSGGRNSTVVRFSGIYGPGREMLLGRARRGGPVQHEPPYYTNRVHRDDCVGALSFLLDQKLAGRRLEPRYLISDDEPAPLFGVVSWLAGRLGVAKPSRERLANQPSSNKRCSNKRIKALGYEFRYPSYREGYADLLNAGPGV